MLISESPAWADKPRDGREQRARQAIEALIADRDALAEITLLNGTTHRGRLEALGGHSFLLVNESGQMRQVPYRQMRRSASLSPGKIAAIAGVTAGVILMI